MNTSGKEYHWEMGHRLPFHEGLCSNVHGHSYRLIVELTGELDENSMIIDFYELDRIVVPLVKKLDHCFVCDENDKMMIDFLKKNAFKYLVISGETTVENLASMIVSELLPQFSVFPNIRSLKVRLFESPLAYTEKTAEL